MIGGRMKNRSTLNDAVTLIRYRPDANPLALALDLCQGLRYRKPLMERCSSKPQFDLNDFLEGKDNGIQGD
jgi:hypothetical protein